MPQHFFRSLPLCLFVCLLNHSPIRAQDTFSITAVASSPEGGRITGEGSFPIYSQQTVTAQANPGWYINRVLVKSPNLPVESWPYEPLAREFSKKQGENFDVASIESTFTLDDNKEILIEFTPKAPRLGSPGVGFDGFLVPTNQFPTVTLDHGYLTLEAWISSGIYPFSFQWLKDGIPFTKDANSLEYRISEVTYNAHGNYSVIVSNTYGSATSPPVRLIIPPTIAALNRNFFPPRVISNSVDFADSIAIGFQSNVEDALIFYTLDGTTPSFSSAMYGGSFDVLNSGILRAVAFTTDISESVELPPIIFTKQANVTLDLLGSSRGYVSSSKNPPYGLGDVVRLQAVESGAYPTAQFLGWTGSFVSTNNPLDVTLSSNITLQAIFGTVVTVTPLGSGKIVGLTTGTVVPLNDTIRFPLDAVPDPGFAFVRWGGAVEGTNSHTVLTNSPQHIVVTALFVSLPTNQFSLTVITEGVGLAGRNPDLNQYPNGSSAIVTAMPGENQQFLGWSGSVTSTENPLSISIASNIIVTAHFSTNLAMQPIAGPYFWNALAGFDVSGSVNRAYRIEQSPNLHDWEMLLHVPALSGPFSPTCPFNPTNRPTFFRGIAE